MHNKLAVAAAAAVVVDVVVVVPAISELTRR